MRARTTSRSLERLIHTVDAALAGGGPPAGAGAPFPAADLSVAVGEALQDPDLLPRVALATPPLGFAKYLLYTTPAWTLFSTATAAELALPVHDHGTWGVVGLFRGSEEEVRYQVDEGAKGRTPGLVEVGRTTYEAGDVMVVEPPPHDVHQVVNIGTKASVGLHLHGRDLVAEGFRLFVPPDYRPVETGPLRYDELP